MYTSVPFLFTAVVALLPLATAVTSSECLLDALQTNTDPSDLDSLCSTLQLIISGNITEICTEDLASVAEAAFDENCLSSDSNSTASIASDSSGSKAKVTSPTNTGNWTAQATGSSNSSAGASQVLSSSTKFGSPGFGSVVVPLAVAAGFVGLYA